MARRNVKFKRESYYHIYNRGADRNCIFFERENYLYLLRKLKHYSQKYNISVIAYCLMPNHYHFLLRQDGDTPINIPVAYLFNGYSKAINKKFNKSGTLFEGPFKAIEVEDKNYLMELCRYIHRNPADDELVKDILEWEFSNYHEWIGKRNGSLFDKEFIKKYFHKEKSYEEFVADFYSYKQAKNDLKKYLQEMNKKKG
jgi:REP element-mobilizing transposase RayT